MNIYIKKYLCILTVFAFGFCSQQVIWGQDHEKDFTDYKNIELTGDIPRDFTVSTNSKFERDIKKIEKKNKREVQKAEKRFYEESNYLIDDMLLSGKVYFDDTITRYANRIIDTLLKDDEELRKEIRVYTVKSPSVNAFTTDDGIIFMNWGLIAKAKNEAQLAYILAHEISHFQKEHIIDNFRESTKMNQGIGVYKKSSNVERMTASSNYSKELEFVADTAGLRIFLNSDYDLNGATSLFDVLSYGQAPFANEDFDYNIFQVDSTFAVKTDIVGNIQYEEIVPNDNEDSDTHPGISERKSKIEKIVGKMSNEGKSEFLVSEDKFAEVQNMIMYELPKMKLYEKDYPMAIYLSSLLLKNDTLNRYLRKNIIKGIYGIAKHKNFKQYDDLIDIYESEFLQGKNKYVYEFFKEMSPLETSALAMTMAYHYQQEYDYNDLGINKIIDNLIQDLVIIHQFELEDFNATVSDSTKYGMSGQINFDLGFVTDEDYYIDLIDRIITDRRVIEDRLDIISDGTYKTFRNDLHKNGYELGIDRLVVADPFYLKIDLRMQYPLDYLASATAKENISEIIVNNAEKLDMKVKSLNTGKLTKRSAQKFEHISFLNTWVEERLSYGGIDMVSIDYNKAVELSKKYKTSNFLWCGIVTAAESDPIGMTKIAYGIFFPPIWPKIFGPKRYTYYYSLLFDITEERPLVYDYNLVKLKDNNATLNSNIYYHLWQMNRD